MRLFEHRPHPYTPSNPNDAHSTEVALGSFNARLAVQITNLVSTMWCAYFFVLLALLGFPGPGAAPAQWVQWLSQTFIQLVMLSILALSGRIASRKQELQIDEQHAATLRLLDENAQIIAHMHAQDAELIQLRLDVAELRTMIEQLLQRRGRVRVRMPVVAEQATQEKRKEQSND